MNENCFVDDGKLVGKYICVLTYYSINQLQLGICNLITFTYFWFMNNLSNNLVISISIITRQIILCFSYLLCNQANQLTTKKVKIVICLKKGLKNPKKSLASKPRGG